MRFFRRRSKNPVAQKPVEALPRSISITGRLLGIQSIGFIILALFAAPAPPIRSHEFNEIWRAALYILLAFLSAAAALGLLRHRPLAWDVAMLLQGTALLQALALYLRERPFYIYIEMAYCILVVLFLNNPELRRSFQNEIIEGQTETRKDRT